jgi:ribosomal protein S18 acetylase RimI-like enzyme
MAATAPTRDAHIHLRPVVAADEGFLRALYAQSRAEELTRAGMDALQREMFVQMQFQLRQTSYKASFPLAVDQIICTTAGVPAGRVLVERKDGSMLLVDIAIATEQQRQGFGTKVIRQLQQECAESGWKMSLQVLKGSAAEGFYRRLGFEVTGEDPLRRQMIWDGTRV